MSLFKKLIVVTSLCLVFTQAVPLKGLSDTPALAARNRLAKRANPQIGEGIDVNNAQMGGRMKPAFKTAQELLAHAVFSEKGIDTDSPIFKHYFKDDHKDKVKKAMLKLMGNPGSLDDALNGEGAQELGQITFQGVDTENTDDDAGCAKEGTRMYTEGYDSDKPTTVVCEDSWVFPDKLNCDDLGDKLTDDFATVGHLVLHEYTHWDWLLKEITGGEIVDEHGTLLKTSGYGLENAYKNLDKEDALLNADSYAWYATETMWSVKCKKDFKEPSEDEEEEDSDDEEEEEEEEDDD
ncbi:MAG: hypothetical protein Q9180_005949 [Flavoplaca navasiana]